MFQLYLDRNPAPFPIIFRKLKLEKGQVDLSVQYLEYKSIGLTKKLH